MLKRVTQAWLAGALLLLLLALSPALLRAEDWLPIAPEDLAMKDNPKHPGDHAMVLWREIVNDDQACRETHYVRIKIFDDAGKSYADVKTEPFNPREIKLRDFQARTIHPDGTIVPFTGDLLEALVVRYRSARYVTRSAALPAVVPGSMIEFRYTMTWAKDNAYGAHWGVQTQLFQHKAHFAFRPNRHWDARWSTHLPKGSAPAMQTDSKGKLVTLDIEDMPPYEIEPYMPPEDEVRHRVEFFYMDFYLAGDAFWREVGKGVGKGIDDYINKPDRLRQYLNAMVESTDTRAMKLQKIYDRVQSFRNLSYAPEETEKESKRENLEENRNIEDVLSHRYGNRNQVNLAFLALARTAGYEANAVMVRPRDQAFFDRNYLDYHQLGAAIVLVKDNGKETFYDPGTPFCPFGVLPWEYTSVMGLKLDKQAPTLMVIPNPALESALLYRKANLTMEADGSAHGTMDLRFFGQEALELRLVNRERDDAERKNRLETMLREWLPVNSTVELLQVNDWTNSKLPLTASFKVSISGFAASAGRRRIFSWSIFTSAYHNPFTAESRVNSVVFDFPYLHSDEISITLPEGFQPEGLPQPKSVDGTLGGVTTEFNVDHNVLHARRRVKLSGVFLPAKQYSVAKDFFEQIGTSRDEKVVLVPAAK